MLEKSDFPLIAHVIIDGSFQHFVVVYEIKKDMVIIADPSKGIRKITIDEWNNITTSKFFIFKPIKKIPIFNNDKKIINILLSFIYEYRLIFITIIIISLIFTILSIITTYNFKLLMDGLDIYNKEHLRIILFVLISFGIIKNLSNLFINKLINFINIIL